MFRQSIISSRQLFPKLLVRNFRSRSNFEAIVSSTSRDKTLDKFKIVFAEGYLAGTENNTKKTPWKTIIAAFLSGILLGFILLPVQSQPKLNFDKDILIKGAQVNTKFDDVKGVNEAKEELQYIVEFLKNPRKLNAIGGKLPKGVLLVGPPGTGKTLLARALAGEAGVPYFQMSGSEFEQLYVGEGARRVRELFKLAKRCAPCVIFIDEIDSVGSKRTHSVMHPHSNQTINQLLTEMDGFRHNEGVIVLAATNRRQDLDIALLRRFDVEIPVAPPNFTGRKDIIMHFLRKIAHNHIDADVLARGTVGFTGANLQNMINRAALKAAAENSPWVTLDHLLSERDRILMGSENKSRIPDEGANEITACHESGHVVVAFFSPFAKQLHKVTIIPRGNTLGHTAFLPEKDESYNNKAQLLAEIDSLLAGRVAEELTFGSDFVTSGAANDLKVATELARNMVTKLGMSNRLRSNADAKDQIEDEVEQILQESYERAKSILRKYDSQHKSLVAALLKHETLDSNEITAILMEK